MPSFRSFILSLFIGLSLTGCMSLPIKAPINQAVAQDTDPNELFERAPTDKADDLLLMMSFSGGGTRAAALAYGVLETLNERPSPQQSTQGLSLAEEVDYISAVSGGSFTAAYYALFGEQLFSDFKQAFLQKNLHAYLRRQLVSFNALRRISSRQYGVSDVLANYYNKKLFANKTIADLFQSNGPVVDINAVDVSRGTRFSFNKSQLRAICTDPASIPVGKAVAASSAVPVAFSAISLRNYADRCKTQIPDWIQQARSYPDGDTRRQDEAERVLSYLRPGKRQYIHLLDGGLVDNLGVRASIARSIAAGSLDQALRLRDLAQTKTMVFIVVDAANWPPVSMDETRDHPPLESIISAATSAPLVQYNKETLTLLRQQFKEWMKLDPTRQAYVIHLNFDQLPDAEREAMLALPTSLALSDKQVDDVIHTGRTMLQSHPEYQRWLKQSPVE